MSLVIEKLVRISDDRGKRVAELAGSRHITENGLIEEGLDLLFRETDLDDIRRVDGEMLRRSEAQLGPVKSPSGEAIRPEDTTFVVGTPVDSERVRRPGDRR